MDFERLPSQPAIAPEAWLASQPHWDLTWGPSVVVLTQPSSTLIVLAFGLFTLVLGVRLWVRHPRLAGARWWGAALVLWGLGALAAGVSYQAFGYALKGVGRTEMAYTDWFEVAYLALSATSIGALGVAVALRSLSGKAQTRLRVVAAVLLGVYFLILQRGVFAADRFALSFEAMVLVTTPSFVLYFVVAVVRWRKTRSPGEARLARAWAGLGLAFALYGLAAALGLGNVLWTYGLWFTENDVLHLALAVWMVFLYRAAR